MNIQKIKNLLKNDQITDIEIVNEIASTSNYLLENNRNFVENKLLVALHQTDSIGQYGKKYYSHEKNGIYFSILLKSNIKQIKTEQLTMILAVAFVETFKELYDKELKIKWVNDIFLDDKKVAGILVQTTFDDNLQDTVIGIGINLFKPKSGYEHEIEDIVNYLFDDELVDRELIIASIINKFYDYYDKPTIVHQLYSKNSLIYKREVYLNDELVFVNEIYEDGSLQIIKDDQTFMINSGHIKLRR